MPVTHSKEGVFMVALDEEDVPTLQVRGPRGDDTANKVGGTYRPFGTFHSRPVYIKATDEQCAYLYFWEDTPPPHLPSTTQGLRPSAGQTTN